MNLWIRYEKYHVCHGGQEEERKANYTDMVRDINIYFILLFLVILYQSLVALFIYNNCDW